MSDLLNYRLVYPDPREAQENPTGGYVEVHITHHTHEAERNIQTAILLAKHGFKVRLLGIDTTPGVKSPDAYFFGDDFRVEFKHNLTPTRSAIEKAIKYANRQATRVVLHILSDVSRDNLLAGVKSRFFFYERMEYIWIIWKDDVFGFNRDEIFDGTIERKIK